VKRAFLILALLASPAFAEDDQTAYVFPVIPDEATKVWALKRAYQLNGNSMVGNNKMIDVSRETPFATPVKTEAVPLPSPAPSPETRLAQAAPAADICTRHGKRRIVTNGGKSWRCR
jgi:hypothetical protein